MCIIYYVFVKFAHSLSLSLNITFEFIFYSEHIFLLRTENLIFHTWSTRVNISFNAITEYLGIRAFFHFMFSNCLPKNYTLNRTFTIDHVLYKLSINFENFFHYTPFKNALDTKSNMFLKFPCLPQIPIFSIVNILHTSMTIWLEL